MNDKIIKIITKEFKIANFHGTLIWDPNELPKRRCYRINASVYMKIISRNTKDITDVINIEFKNAPGNLLDNTTQV